MKLNKSQLSQLAKWAKGGRLYVRVVLTPEMIPEWGKRDFDLARELVRMAKRQIKAVPSKRRAA